MVKVNRIFGYAFMVLGGLKILLIIVLIMQLGSALASLARNSDFNIADYTVFGIIVGAFEWILIISSIVMAILNSRTGTTVTRGYIIPIGAIILQLLFSGFIGIFIYPVACGLYIKSGTILLEEKPRKENVLDRLEKT